MALRFLYILFFQYYSNYYHLSYLFYSESSRGTFKIAFSTIITFVVRFEYICCWSLSLTLETYGDIASLYPNNRFWFQWFKRGDFDVNDKEWPGGTETFEDNELQDLFEENPAQILKKLSDSLAVAC